MVVDKLVDAREGLSTARTLPGLWLEDCFHRQAGKSAKAFAPKALE
jgi:hypothetical protein